MLILPYVNRADPRIAKAQADLRSLESAIRVYAQHMGSPPATLADLTAPATNSQGATAGPFMATVPAAPTGWSEYRYEVRADGTFTISISSPEGSVIVPTQ